MNYTCRGCDGTCCTGVGSEPCTCPPPPDPDDNDNDNDEQSENW